MFIFTDQYTAEQSDIDEECPLLIQSASLLSENQNNPNSQSHNLPFKPLNIVHIASECVPFVWGGLGHAIAGLANSQAKAGHNVAVILPYSPYLKTHSDQGLHLVADFDVDLPQHNRKHHCVVFRSGTKNQASTLSTPFNGRRVDSLISLASLHSDTEMSKDSLKTVVKTASLTSMSSDSDLSKSSTNSQTVNNPAVYFIHHPLLNGKDIYAYEDSDNLHYVSIKAALEFVKRVLIFPGNQKRRDAKLTTTVLNKPPVVDVDVIHFHDWVCGLGPLLMRSDEAFTPVPSSPSPNNSFQQQPTQAGVTSVFTIHNGAYQGMLSIEESMKYGLESSLFHEPVTLKGQISQLRLGILFADKVTTVSPTYRIELMQSAHGMGNEDILRLRSKEGDFVGILNGIDSEFEWNPSVDRHISTRYDIRTSKEGKQLNKAWFQRTHGLKEEPAYPLMVICSRITKQKGIQLLLDNLSNWITQHHLQLVVIGNVTETDLYGKNLWTMLEACQTQYPDMVALFKYDSILEHQAIAAADLFFMASLFEPCGLAHQHAGRYGAITVGTPVGGICDTTVNYFTDPLNATAFIASTVDVDGINHALTVALTTYASCHSDQPASNKWSQLVTNAMKRDASWDHVCPDYINLYNDAKQHRRVVGHPGAFISNSKSDEVEGVVNEEDLEAGCCSSCCQSCMTSCCCANKWFYFDVELFNSIPQIFHACKTTPARNDFLYVIFKTSLINLAARSYFIMVELEDEELELTYAILSLTWYQLQDCVFTIFGQTYMKFLGKIGPLVRIYGAEFGDLCFVLVILFVLEFSNRLILGPLNGNYAAYTWQGMLTILYNLIQGIVSSGPVDPTINKLRTRGIISHTTAMHIFQIMGLSLLFGLLATFGYQTLHAIVLATQFTIFSSIYICLIIFKNPAARLRNAGRMLAYIFLLKWLPCCSGRKSRYGKSLPGGRIDKWGHRIGEAPSSMYEINLSIGQDVPIGTTSERSRDSDAMSIAGSIAESISSLTGNTTSTPYYPSPSNWSDEIFYSILIDRFNIGRDETKIPSSHIKLKGEQRHGGDIKGILLQLNYLQELGVTTLLISPILTNTHEVIPGIESYHGYSPIHLLEVDPRIGTMEDFQMLVQACHERNMRIILDFPLNHVGCVFEYVDNDSQYIDIDQPPKQIANPWKYNLKPIELMSEEHFIRHGVIDNWDNEQQQLFGDFPPNFRKLSTNRKETQDILLNILRYWMKETDIDGYRIDAAKHIDKTFLQRIDYELHQYATNLCNKHNFLLLLEHSSGMDEDILPYLLMSQSTSCHVMSNTSSSCSFYAYNYPEYRRVNAVLHGEAPTRELEISAWKSQCCFDTGIPSVVSGDASGQYYPNMSTAPLHSVTTTCSSLQHNLVRFIDNHDVYRFLRTTDDEGVLYVSIAYLLFSIGIPMLYYGTEQLFRQDYDSVFIPESASNPADPNNRMNMFQPRPIDVMSNEDVPQPFNTTLPIYLYIRRLSDIRKQYLPLSRGSQIVRYSDPTGAGLYVYSRIYEGKEVLVCLNTSLSTKTAVVTLSTGSNVTYIWGTEYYDVLDIGYITTIGPSMLPLLQLNSTSNVCCNIKITVPGRNSGDTHGVRVLVQRGNDDY